MEWQDKTQERNLATIGGRDQSCLEWDEESLYIALGWLSLED